MIHKQQWLFEICMKTSSNGNVFRVTGPLWGESTGHRWIPLSNASDVELWCFFDLRLNTRFSKQTYYDVTVMLGPLVFRVGDGGKPLILHFTNQAFMLLCRVSAWEMHVLSFASQTLGIRYKSGNGNFTVLSWNHLIATEMSYQFQQPLLIH